MELFVLYLWLKLGAIIGLFNLAGGITTLILIILVIRVSWNNMNVHNWPSLYPNLVELHYSQLPYKKMIAFIAACFIFGAMLPTQTQTAVLVGGHYALKLADSPEASKVMSVLRLKANEILDAELQKASPSPSK